jgi:hypothetical protein
MSIIPEESAETIIQAGAMPTIHKNIVTAGLFAGKSAFSLNTHDPFGAFVVINLFLACGKTAAVEISPIEGIITHALAVCLQEGAPDLLTALAAIGAGFAVFPGRIHLNKGEVWFAHGWCCKRDRGREFPLKPVICHDVGISYQARTHVSVFPEPVIPKEPITEKGR